MTPRCTRSRAATIDRLAADDAVFTADVGTPCIWAARISDASSQLDVCGVSSATAGMRVGSTSAGSLSVAAAGTGSGA